MNSTSRMRPSSLQFAQQEILVTFSRARIDRLLETAYRSPLVAVRFHEQWRLRGPEMAVATACGEPRGLSPLLWFGFRRGILDSEARNRGNAALAELKAAAVDNQHNLSLLSDLEKSRVQLLHAREAALDRSRAAVQSAGNASVTFPARPAPRMT